MSSNDKVPQIEKGTYRHNKSGRLYEVLGIAIHTETSEFLVVYRPLYQHKQSNDFYTRPYAMFTQVVMIEGDEMPRFEIA